MLEPAGGISAASSPTSRPRGKGTLLNGLVFLAAFLGTCVLLGRLLPFPEVPVVQEKLAHLARQGDEYDALFLGSSRIYFQVLPAIFDQAVRERGLPVRSFNAGVAAMVPPEDNYYLDRILQSPHRRLRWVFLELMPFGARADTTLQGTGRFSYWHDWPRTCLLTQSFLEDCIRAWHREKGRECWQALGLWTENLRLFLMNFSNVGRGESLVRQRFELGKKRKTDGAKKSERWDGWIFPEKVLPLTGKSRADYEKEYAALVESTQRFTPGDSASWEALRIKLAKLTAAGVTPILVIPPTVAPQRFLPPQLASQSTVIMDFSAPQDYPEFFTVERRMDGVHLNYEGSEMFTEAIARKFVEMTKGGKDKP